MEKHSPELEFVFASHDILEILIHSKENGNVVGITSPLLGPGIFITAVDKVILDYETIVQLKHNDVTGGRLERNTLKLTDITSACSFRSSFEKVHNNKKTINTSPEVYSF